MNVILSKSNKLFLLSTILLSLLACNLLSGLQKDLEGVISTAAVIATQARGGQEMLATGHALATQFADSQFAETAKALITEVSLSSAIETLQAIATEQAPGISETYEAILTQVPPLAPLPPEDIPIIEGEKENLVITKSTISYQVALPFPEVVSYYKREMLQNGWSYQSATSRELQNFSILNYKKENRMATISINLNPANLKIIVTIILNTP